jgi:cytochrome c oxidase subunit 4
MSAVARTAVRVARRTLATAAAPHAPAASVATPSASRAAIPLANIEAQWERMPKEDQSVVHQQLEELQKKDWKQLSLAEKKAGAFTELLEVQSAMRTN